MKNLGVYLLVIILAGACVSRTELASLNGEYREIRGSNRELRKQIKLYLDSQKKLSDTLYLLHYALQRKATPRQIPKIETKQPVRNMRTDSAKIEICLFATREEKNAYHYLNYARTKPKEFCEKYVVPNWDKNNSYENSLVQTMRSMEPVPPVYPELQLFQSALCHARTSGKSGYVGHDRQKDPKTGSKCNSYFMGECCSYGYDDGLGIILQLLIDNRVPSLGHRKICLSEGYTKVGISIQPHERYDFNCVLDFM